jgi:DnaJ-domain-containing protein 1
MVTRADVTVILVGLLVGFFLVSWIVDKVKLNHMSASRPSNRSRAGKADDQQPSPEYTQENRPGTPRPWYVVLQVPAEASLDNVKLAYRRRMSEYHPDKVAGLGDDLRALAETKSKEINAAYETAIRTFGSQSR